MHREDREGRTVLSHLHIVDLIGELIRRRDDEWRGVVMMCLSGGKYNG